MKSKKTLIVALVVVVLLVGYLILAVPQWSTLNEHKAQVSRLKDLNDAIVKLYDTGRDPTETRVKTQLGEERSAQLFEAFVVRWGELPARAERVAASERMIVAAYHAESFENGADIVSTLFIDGRKAFVTTDDLQKLMDDPITDDRFDHLVEDGPIQLELPKTLAVKILEFVWSPMVFSLTILLATIFIPTMYVGPLVADKLRMRDHSPKISFFLLVVTAAIVVIWAGFPPKFGVDLKGGVILIYNANLENTNDAMADPDNPGSDRSAGRVSIADLAAALGPRINPGGTKEIIIRPYGDSQIEIIIPEVDNREIDEIKERIKSAGVLVFRIVANETDHQSIINAAKKQAERPSQTARLRDVVSSPTDKEKTIGRWVRAGRDDTATKGFNKLKQDWTRYTIRDGESGKLIEDADIPVDSRYDEKHTKFESWLARSGIDNLQVLVVEPSGQALDVHGDDLGMIAKDFDEMTNLCVAFSLNSRGAARMGALTSSNLPDPDTGVERQLGIVLDNTLLSAPNIQSTITNRGRITGRFTSDEIDFLINILRAGKLPAALDPVPATQNIIGPTLGQDTIDKGARSIGISLIVVLVFIGVYYRFSGMVACVVLVLNIVFTFSLIILIKAPLTLPGLAGLVLTVGMSVDANVLIFERIREELAKGAKLRLAVRQGFERATRTIVDANITTLITAVVLYAIGTDQVRGFAIMLILGILMCMFTAIFCARLIFDVAIHRNWVSDLKMTQILPKTNIDFLGKRYLAGVISVLLIGVGIGAVVMRGSEILDIDFTGGTSVTIVSADSLDADSVRKKLAAGAKDVEPDQKVDITVVNVQMSAYAQDSVWKIVTSLETEEKIKSLITQSLKVESYTMTGVRIAADDTDSAGGEGRGTGGCQEDELDDELDDESDDESTAAADEEQVSYLLTFSHPIASSALLGNFDSAAETLNMGAPGIVIDPPPGVFDDEHDEKEWFVTIGLSAEPASALVAEVTEQLDNKPVWISASTIGGKVAGKTQETAIAALVASLFGIVIYIWIRFQKIVFGLAAVIALIHDVLITLGAIAISAWLAQPLGFLLMDEFRISLPVVAAFLTIIGYSLNDTIVVFDRIREVRGRSPELSAEMVNTSINQTLSRTILTSFTTLLVVLILYTIGGQGIHGFAYALIIGVMVGTYSSIFVASPSLILMMDWVVKRAEKKKVSRVSRA